MKKNIFSASRYFLFLCFVASLLIYSSCDKDDDVTPNYFTDSTTVEGRILEFGTNIPIANATVMLKECEQTHIKL